MRLLSSFRKKDSLHEQAERLVPAAQIMAISAFVPLLDQYPVLREVKPEAWDFFATAGALFIAINSLKIVAPQRKRFMNIYAVLLPYMRKWDKRGEDAVLDCQAFVAKNVESGASPQDSLGFWVLRNAARKEPTAGDAPAARAIGFQLSAPLREWWQE